MCIGLYILILQTHIEYKNATTNKMDIQFYLRLFGKISWNRYVLKVALKKGNSYFRKICAVETWKHQAAFIITERVSHVSIFY